MSLLGGFNSIPSNSSATGADLDGDGRTDLVLTFTQAVSIYRQTPFGWSPSHHAHASSTTRPVLVDLEGDGDLDLVCIPTMATGGALAVYENQQGTFAPVTPAWYPWGYGAAVGDVDVDGFADLVLSTATAPRSIQLARGGAGLQFTLDPSATPTGLPYGLLPELLDADGDGDLDILAASTSTYCLLRNVGGAFVDATSTLPATRAGVTELRCADYDADGRADCAATLSTGDIDMLWGGPAGFTFAPAVVNVPSVVSTWQGLWPGDFDDDGDVDLLASRGPGLQDSSLDVLWNQGLRRFSRATVVAGSTNTCGVADVDKDGAADIVFATGFVRCLFRARHEDVAWAMSGATANALQGSAIAAAGDVDGDGRTDLVNVGPNRVYVSRALGGGYYAGVTYTPPIAGALTTWSAQLADLDRDGDLDLAVKSTTALTLLANTGAGSFPSSQHTASASLGHDELRLGDIDGDGDLDILLAEGRGIVLFRNLGAMAFAPATIVVPPNPTPRCLELADVDGDGDLDVVCDVVAPSGLTHVVAANDGQGNFAPNAAFYVNLGTAPTSVRAGDFDGDGDVDLASLDGTPRVYRNDGNGSFTDRTPFDLPSVLTSGHNLVVADLDEDGDLDLAAPKQDAPQFTPQVIVLLNSGAGAFVDRTAQRTQGGSSSVWGLRAADVDDDGDLDLISPQQGVLGNHLRQCVSTGPPRIGRTLELRLLTGPGFGQPGLGLLGVGFALAAPPLAVPGLAGRLELDPATLQVLASVVTSPIGVSSVFVGVPPDAALMGLEVWFQGAIVPMVGRPGFTNVIHEIVVG